MNKYEKALDRIAFNYGLSALDKQTNEIMDEKFNEDIGVLMELVERATPKKPKKYITPYNYIEFECPNCHTVTHTNFIRPYCGECGQALDWSEDDES